MWRNKHNLGKKNEKYNYPHDHSQGYYVGFKLILAINQEFEILSSVIRFYLKKELSNSNKSILCHSYHLS
jgi:hypothetical protein